MQMTTYAQDLEFLRDNLPDEGGANIVELTGAGESLVAVAPAYQGRVMTSSTSGADGVSFGWINEDFIRRGRRDQAFNNYGGEDRFWLGPEAGQFGLWFKKGDPFDLDHWRTPLGLNEGQYRITSQGATSVCFAAEFALENYSGARFECAVKRTIRTIDRGHASELLGATPPQDLHLAAFESDNVLSNIGDNNWSREGGLLSIWILGMFKAGPHAAVIVPFEPGPVEQLGPMPNTEYFSKMPPERCAVKDDWLWFRCDGVFRAKIGVSPNRAREYFGSYDPGKGALTIIQYYLPPNAGELPYVNSTWEIQDDPYAGDAVNSYNDGGRETPGGAAPTFYELERSSPAARLDAGKSVSHYHRTFHLTGPDEALRQFADKVLGIDPARIKQDTPGRS